MKRLLQLALVCAMLHGIAFAAVTQNMVVTAQIPRAYKAQILPANTTVPVTLAAGGTNGTKIVNINCANTDTVNQYIVLFSVLRSAVSYAMFSATVPAGSGFTTNMFPTTVMQFGLAFSVFPNDSDGNPYFFLESTDTLQMASTTTVAVGKAVSCTTVGADF